MESASGARITSLKSAAGREWLWTRTNPRRTLARPGDPFVDAGGVEECFPTIAGKPDHGSVWARPWNADAPNSFRVETSTFALRRTHRIVGTTIEFRYSLTAVSGTPFLWAFHALIDPDPGLTLEVETGEPVLTWAAGKQVRSAWPVVGDIVRYDDLDRDDGTAVFALLPERHAITARRGSDTFDVEVHAKGQPASIGLWRNLTGYSSDGGPAYRSLGIEPILGRHPNLSQAGPRECARVPPSGVVTWFLRVRLRDGSRKRGN